MVKLQHERKRGPGLFHMVNGTRYEIDADGVVEASDEDAAVLAEGRLWRHLGEWPDAAATAAPASGGGGRRVRTRQEMLAKADEAGVKLPEAETTPEAETETPEPVEAAAEPAATDDDDEVVTVSEDMTRRELLAIAKANGYAVGRNMNKAQILSLFDTEQ